MSVALAQGDVNTAAIVTALEHSGYAGWYVLEQDAIFAGPLDGRTGEAGTTRPETDVRASLDHPFALADGIDKQAAKTTSGGEPRG
jgi:inosose dehydratase